MRSPEYLLKNIGSYYLVSFLLLGLFACRLGNPKSEGTQKTPIFSESYQPPAFVEDDRRSLIKALGPRLQELFDDYLKTANIPGVAYGIVIDDELVLASASGLINREKMMAASTKSAFRIASMTKSFTAMAILMLRDQGRLSLKDPVQKYIPEMSELKYLTSDASVIDIENLLTMTAGFPEDNPWGDRQLDETDEMLMDLMSNGVSFSNPTSYQFEYSNTGYALLAKVISRIAGISYQNYISDSILRPLGMAQTYWEIDSVPAERLAIGYRWEEEKWKLEPMLHDGSFGAMGGLITSIEDFSKYVSYHLSAWPPRSETDQGPLRRSSLREMHTPQFSRLFALAKNNGGEPCPIISGYGYGLGISEDCEGLRRISHGGALPGFGSNFVFYPEYGIGLMAFCNLTYTTPWPYSDIMELLFEELDLPSRQLPVSDILKQRQEQITALIQSWSTDLENQILAENFYLDRSRDHRKKEIQEILVKAGDFQSVGILQPRNQLRGSYQITTATGNIDVFFTLTPEKDPKVQRLNVSFKEANSIE